MFFIPLFLNWVTLWVALRGDFNGILSSADKVGGRNFGLPSHFDFHDFVHSNALIDMWDLLGISLLGAIIALVVTALEKDWTLV